MRWQPVGVMRHGDQTGPPAEDGDCPARVVYRDTEKAVLGALRGESVVKNALELFTSRLVARIKTKVSCVLREVALPKTEAPNFREPRKRKAQLFKAHIIATCCRRDFGFMGVFQPRF